MRIDKFLWCVRFFKTRNLATEACKTGKIKMDGQPLKPSREVFIGQQITVRKEQIDYVIEVLAFPESRVGAKLTGLYIKDCTPPENLEKLDLLKYAKDYYRKKGTGRPTKKDRRDLDDFVS
jgi:ribosome-associated heat shock protein Hsp15